MKPAGLILLGLLLVSTSGLAQVRGRIDAGLGGPGAWSMAPELRLERGRTRIELTGEYRDFGGPGQGLAGTLAASWFRPLSGPLLLELAGTAQGQTGVGLEDAGAWWAGPRLHLRGADRGLWLGLAAGRDHLGSTRRWEAAAWKTIGTLSIQLQGWQTATNLPQSVGPDTAGPLPDTLADPAGRRLRTTTDLGLWLRWGASRLEVALASGMRFGLRDPGLAVGSPADRGPLGQQTRPTTVSSTWWLAEATWWLMDRVGLVGTVGRQPIDPSFATIGQSFVRLGFRAALQRRRPEPLLVVPSHSAGGFRASRMDEATVEFTLAAPGATGVEIMGDFTDWSPVTMERERPGGIWRVRLPAAPGLHRINVRYDGGTWRAPPATRIVHDEFGQECGELMIG